MTSTTLSTRTINALRERRVHEVARLEATPLNPFDARDEWAARQGYRHSTADVCPLVVAPTFTPTSG